MKRTLLILCLFSFQCILFAQKEWRLERWTQAYGKINNQALGLHVGYLGKKGDTTIVSVTEANEVINVYYIKTPADTIPRFKLKGINCTTGDFNGDGLNDLLAYGNPTRIYLAKEEGVFDTIPFFEKYGEVKSYHFGDHIAIGDFNKDNYDDIFISDVGYPNMDQVGRVLIFWGGTVMDTSYFQLSGTHKSNGFGWNITSGDLNNDGFDDIIVKGLDQSQKGARGTIRRPYIKIFAGGNSTDTIPWKSFDGDLDESWGLASMDVNGDNVKDLLWSNYSAKDSMPAVYIHFSIKGDVDSIPSMVILEYWSENIVNAGDMNGDGYNDIVVSSNTSDQSGDSFIFVYSGGPKMDINIDAGFGLIGSSEIGSNGSITGIGDINNDGFDDIIAGAPGYKWFTDAGYWAIFLGSPNIPVTGIKDSVNTIPEDFKLLQNYPNPFNPSTTIEYKLSNNGKVTLRIFNELGEEVKTLVEEYQTRGTYKVDFNARNLSSGVYYYALTSTGTEGKPKLLTKQMILLK